MIEILLFYYIDEEVNLEKLNCYKLVIVILGVECKFGFFLVFGDLVDLKTCDLLKK